MDSRGQVSGGWYWCRQTESPRSRRRCRYRAVGRAEGLGTLDESEQTEGRSVRPFDGGGLWPLTRESLLVARTREPTGQKDNRIDPSWYGPQVRSIQGLDCAFSENLLAWNHARGMVLREGTSWSSWERQALLLPSTTECGNRASSIATERKDWNHSRQTNMLSE